MALACFVEFSLCTTLNFGKHCLDWLKIYEVPEALRAEVAAVEPAAYAETSWGTPAVDVVAGVHAQLERLGVTDRQASEICTLESADHFSYRREGTTGRLAGYVWLDR